MRASAKSVSLVDVSHIDLPYIHPLRLALLKSVHDAPGELSSVLRQDWVRSWEGWAEANTQFDSALHADDEHEIAEELVVRFACISMANVHERFISMDTQCRALA